jgi:hypothetical protein
VNTDLSTSSTAEGASALKREVTLSSSFRDVSTTISALAFGFAGAENSMSVKTPRVPSDPTKSFGRSSRPSWTTLSSL